MCGLYHEQYLQLLAEAVGDVEAGGEVGWLGQGRMVGSTSRVDSLRLVGFEQYGKEYQINMQDIITNWAESSDPEKFVHEDLGIPAYILLLWGQ